MKQKHHVDYAVLGVVPLEILRLINKDPKFRKLGMKRADGQWSNPTRAGSRSGASEGLD